MKATVTWAGDVKFEAKSGSGHTLIIDGPPDHGGKNQGVRPMELMLLRGDVEDRSEDSTLTDSDPTRSLSMTSRIGKVSKPPNNERKPKSTLTRMYCQLSLEGMKRRRSRR